MSDTPFTVLGSDAPAVPAQPAQRSSGPASSNVGRGCEVGALLLRLEQGDASAFTELYERTSHRVYGLVRKVLVDPDLSAETTQDVFLALWVGSGVHFDPAKGSGISWVMTLAHRRAVDRVRAEESHRVRDLKWGLKNRGDDHDQVTEVVIQNAETDQLRESLSKLSDLQREAISLAYYRGLTYVQVAEHLGIPIPTAKTRIRDGIRHLSSHLQNL
ncbi:ECF RNA polymerase sigma factor SigK [Arthrobacter sp. CP30]